jgi:hypothetical protein
MLEYEHPSCVPHLPSYYVFLVLNGILHTERHMAVLKYIASAKLCLIFCHVRTACVYTIRIWINL